MRGDEILKKNTTIVKENKLLLNILTPVSRN